MWGGNAGVSWRSRLESARLPGSDDVLHREATEGIGEKLEFNRDLEIYLQLG